MKEILLTEKEMVFLVLLYFHDLNQSHSLPGFEFRQFEGCIIFYRPKFDNVLQFSTTLNSIRIDEDLHVQLQYNGTSFSLPSWFINSPSMTNICRMISI